jgi:uncharacterized beta-barrel protein YwiB (DUF1934 family)
MAAARKKAIRVQANNYIEQARDGEQVKEVFTTNTDGFYYEVGSAFYIEYLEEITEAPVNVRLKFVSDQQVVIRRQAFGTETTMTLVKDTMTDILYPIANQHTIVFQGMLTQMKVEVGDNQKVDADIRYKLYQAGEMIGQYQITLQSRAQV